MGKRFEDIIPRRCALLCQEQSSTSGSVMCSKIEKYHKDAAVSKLESDAESHNASEAESSFPGQKKQNLFYGNFIVATRDIEPGELIIYERSLLTAPCSFSHQLAVCLSCNKEITLSDKCSKCNWSICGPDCQQNESHRLNECEIFARNSVQRIGLPADYFGVETLRCLLLRESAPDKWKKILRFESHKAARAGNTKAQKSLQFITKFIRFDCKLQEYDEEVIDHVVGVLSVNTFCAYNNLKTYTSVLFNKVSLFTHDCDPNTLQIMVNHGESKTIQLAERDFSLQSPTSDYHISNNEIAVGIYAIRSIKNGELITVSYIDKTLSVNQRRQILKENFYFGCTCSKCLIQQTEETIAIVEASFPSDPYQTRKCILLLYGTFIFSSAMCLGLLFFFWLLALF